MPPKDMKEINYSKVYIADPVTGGYSKLGHVSDVELKDETSIYPNVLRSMDIFKAWELKFNLIPCYKREAMFVFFTTGNDLYLRFPKKLRRRRRR